MDASARTPLAPSLDAVVSRCVGFDPAEGRPGYEFVRDDLVLIHPEALESLRRRLVLSEALDRKARELYVEGSPRERPGVARGASVAAGVV